MLSFHFHTALYGIPSLSQPSLPSHVTVREVHPSDLDLFADLTAQGFLDVYEGSASSTQQMAESMNGLYNCPGWHLYLAYIEKNPAGTALLHMQNQTASLAAATTPPLFRGRGCQIALLYQRMLDAARAQCTLLVGQTGVGTGSQHNMERVGMQVAYTKAI